MDEKKLARFLRFSVIKQQLEMGNLTQNEATKLLSGPLTPGDDSTIVDDSRFLVFNIQKFNELLEAEDKNLTVYEIDLTSKYVLIYPFELTYQARERIKQIFTEWMKSDDRILVLEHGAKLVKVDTDRLKKEYQEAQSKI